MLWKNPFSLPLILVMTGVEYLPRDVKDTTISTLATEVSILFFLPFYLTQDYHIFRFSYSLPPCMFLCNHHGMKMLDSNVSGRNENFIFMTFLQVIRKLAALKGLDAQLELIRSYLDLVIEGKLPINHKILYHLQVPFLNILLILICKLQL